MVAQALSSLLQRASIDDHDEVLTSANDVLAKSKSDLYAQHVKVVALSKLDRYEDSLRLFEEAGDSLKKRAPLEYAYALYKSGKVEEAIDVITQLGGGRGANHLEAQAVRIPEAGWIEGLELIEAELPCREVPSGRRPLPRPAPG